MAHMTQTRTMQSPRTVGDLRQLIDGMPDDTTVRFGHTQGDRNESTQYSISISVAPMPTALELIDGHKPEPRPAPWDL